MPSATVSDGLRGTTVVCFESRMAEAMAGHVASHGGQAISAPALREIPLEANGDAFAFGEKLLAGQVDVVLFLTGVGARLLLEALATRTPIQRLTEALTGVTVLARGPKPVGVLKEHGIPVTLTIPDPSTWREIVQALDFSSRSVTLTGKTVAVQEYGLANDQLIRALAQRGATVLRVPVYRWGLPDDTGPLREAIEQILHGHVDVALFTNSTQVKHVMQVASAQGVEEPLRKAFGRLVTGSVGPTTSEVLGQYRLPVDWEASHPRMEALVKEVATRIPELLREKTQGPTIRLVGERHGGKSASPARMAEGVVRRAQSPFLKACRREPTPFTPVWLMRQAGRYLKEYQKIRNRVPFLEMCKTKELVAEVTITATERIRADAAIVFSDILLVVEPMGLGLEYREGEGPIVSGEVATAADIDRLPELEPSDSLAFVFDGVRLTRASLNPQIPLIGFAGAPFTVASYIIEGGSSKSFLQTKQLMYSDPGLWHALLSKISRGLTKYLNGQIAAGVDAVQLFDTWVGCLGPAEYREFVLPHTQSVIQSLTPGVPVIHFGTGTGLFLEDFRTAGGDVIGVDFRVDLNQAWRAIGTDVGIQGNLDPVVLCSTRKVIRERVRRILEHAGGRPGHIFNLGHGVLPTTPVEHVVGLIEDVHELSQR